MRLANGGFSGVASTLAAAPIRPKAIRRHSCKFLVEERGHVRCNPKLEGNVLKLQTHVSTEPKYPCGPDLFSAHVRRDISSIGVVGLTLVSLCLDTVFEAPVDRHTVGPDRTTC